MCAAAGAGPWRSAGRWFAGAVGRRSLRARCGFCLALRALSGVLRSPQQTGPSLAPDLRAVTACQPGALVLSMRP
jgi:hypothetical protein